MFDCIIVNYNSGKTLEKCITSLCNEKIYNLNKIIIIDNNSDDNSCSFIKNSSRINLFELNENFGFARGCNIGASHAESDYYFFLNPDTIIKNSNLDSLFNYLVNNQNIGIVGPKILDKNRNFVMTCRHFPNLINVLVHQSGFKNLLNHSWLVSQSMDSPSQTVPTIIGAAFMVNKKTFSLLGGFDEDYFVYFEEVDFCLRAKNAGYATMYLSSSSILHIGNITSKSVPIDVLSYSLMSRLIYFKKNRPLIEFIIMFCYVFLFEFLIRLIRSIYRRKNPLVVFYAFFNLFFKFNIQSILFKIRGSEINQIKKTSCKEI